MDTRDIPYFLRAGIPTGSRSATPEGQNDCHYDLVTGIMSFSNADGSAWVEIDFSEIGGVPSMNLGDLSNAGDATPTKGAILMGDDSVWSDVGPPVDGKVWVSDDTQPSGWDDRDFKLTGLLDVHTVPPDDGQIPVWVDGDSRFEFQDQAGASAAEAVAAYLKNGTQTINVQDEPLLFPSSGADHSNAGPVWNSTNRERFTAPTGKAGYYRCEMRFWTPDGSADSDAVLQLIRIDGGTLTVTSREIYSSYLPSYGLMVLSAITYLNAGGYVYWRVWRPGGAPSAPWDCNYEADVFRVGT